MRRLALPSSSSSLLLRFDKRDNDCLDCLDDGDYDLIGWLVLHAVLLCRNSSWGTPAKEVVYALG